MKKILLFLGFLCMFALVTQAQDCPFKVHVSVIDATCFNNGKLVYYLENEDGDVMTVEEYNDSHLDEVRIYTKVNETDSVHYSGTFYKGGLDTFVVDHGTYIVGVEGLCSDGHGGWFKKDTVLGTYVVNTSYTVPLVSTLFIIDSVGFKFGRHSTLECSNMGRVQLRIENGSFPYTVEVKPHGTQDVYRTIVFDGNQYSGNDSTRYDYYKYYTIDTLPAGDWDFYVVDGCNYGLPRSGQIVEEIPFPYLDYVELYASSGNMVDSNVIRIRATINSPYDYYTDLIPDYVQYRFVYRDPASGTWIDPGANSWKDFPALSSNKITLYDTTGVNFCDLDSIRFEYKVENSPGGCSDTVIQRTFKFSKPNSSKFSSKKVMAGDDVVRDGCREYKHQVCDYYSIQYSDFNLNYVSRGEHETHRYHFTHPLTWIYIDSESGDTIKTEYVSAINQPSKLFASEVEALYGPLPQTLHVTRKLVDAMGCELYSSVNNILVYDERVDTIKPQWSLESAGSNHCCSTQHRITVKGSYSEGINPDGTIIKLVVSPDNNKYNFKAVYQASTHTWTITKYDIRNMATIDGAIDGKSLDLKDFCLVSGQYIFEISSPCEATTKSKVITFPDYYTTELIVPLARIEEKECTDWYITYTQGQLARIGHNKDAAGHDVTHRQDLETRFQVVSGPLGGYDNQWYEIGSRIRLSIPGVYVIKIFPTTKYEICEYTPIYDTIYFENTTVEHLYAYAVLCDNSSTSGNVYVKGINGLAPYRYTLYSHANLEGVNLGTNTSGQFFNISMRTDTALSCIIEDQCGAYFHVNFFPQLLADLQITWFDNGLHAITSCEGSTVSVHTLTSDNIMYYAWTGPDGSIVHEGADPLIFIPRGAEAGYYSVQVYEMGCERDITDSIYIDVNQSPMVIIDSNTTICPGGKAYFSFIPRSFHEPAPIVNFSLAFETETGREIRNYSSLSGVPVRDSVTTMVPMKIYPVDIQDDECGYPFADSGDTTYISISSNVIRSCDIFTIDDYVCHDNDATLHARSTVDFPYTIRWYSDMTQNHLLKEDVITSAEEWSTYDTSHVIQQILLYVSVDKEGYCPSVNNSYTGIVNMQEDTIHMNCAQSYRIFDSGGMNGDYGEEEMIKQTFTTDSGRKIVMIIDRDSWDLSYTSHLLVISGTELHTDSILYDLSNGSYFPEIIISRDTALTLFFMSGEVAAGGWSALVEPMPGVAVADAYPPNITNFYDEVCQSSSLPYDNIYNISPLIASQSELDEAVKRAGLHVFSYNFVGPESMDKHHCDSLVNFTLMVNDPPFVDTMVVTTNFQLNGEPYHWRGMDIDSTGRYSKINMMADGCDSLDILSLIILQIDTSTNEICEGESTTMGISVETPRLVWKEGEIPAVEAPGDVFCTDGSILRVDAFLASGKRPVGVVYYIDPTGKHGKIIALKDAPNVKIDGKDNYWGIWAQGQAQDYKYIHAVTKYNKVYNVLFDMRGTENTLKIKIDAEQRGDFSYYAPSAYYCYYYNESSGVVDPSNPGGWGWYLPAMGELNILFGNRVPVNATLKKLKEAGFDAEVMDTGQSYYVSSSEQDDNNCWHNDYSGHFKPHYKYNSKTWMDSKNKYHIVRPSRDF
ncbi:MAG: hypothetical protein J6P65_04875 [Bacteroidales bacterium]|nr:hypothetical protein [Bacteroidales bacterium]